MEKLGSTDRSVQLKERSISRIVAAFAARENASVEEILELALKLDHSFRSHLSKTKINDGNFDRLNLADEPVIPIEEAVTRDKVFCLCCGKGFAMLKRHLGAEHGLNEVEYRRKYSLPDSYPLVAPGYSERKAAISRRIGFGKHDRENAIL
jgi:predicted transcriptional regulator